MKRLAVLFSVVSVLLVVPAAVAATPSSAGMGDAGQAPSGAPGRSVATASPRQPCADHKYNFLGPRASWRHSLDWSFRSSSVPAGLSRSAVLKVIKRSFANVTGARNDCGRQDAISATSTYLGSSTRKPNVTAGGGCGSPDGHNVVGFAPLSRYYAGYTCIWWSGQEIVEADIRLNSTTRWALARASCANDLMMEALVTHEVGHAFGLAHVGEAKHGRLTMSVYIDGLCENQEATLGAGDLDGLEKLY